MTRARELGRYGGRVLQVVNVVNTTNLTVNPAAYAQGVFYDTGTQATITPISANSRILILVNQSYFHDHTGAQGTGFRINRNGTDITLEQGFTASYTGPNRVHGYHAMDVYDAPGTTSPVTYKVRAAHWNITSGTGLEYQYGGAQSPSRITLLEIAA